MSMRDWFQNYQEYQILDEQVSSEEKSSSIYIVPSIYEFVSRLLLVTNKSK